MLNLTPNTVLRNCPNLRVNLYSGTEVGVTGKYGLAQCDISVLSVLEIFARPTTLQKGMEKLGERISGVRDWIRITATISRLWQDGILVDSDESTGGGQRLGGFDSPIVHARMLNDRERTDCFIRAISQNIKAGDVVVDIGTGTGVLAMAAARAGAEHVYAIEAGEMAGLAEKLIAENGYSGRITVIRDWSSHVRLDRKADVIVSEIVGNDPLDEGILEVLHDARGRFLKQDGRMIPATIRIYCLPVKVPGRLLSENTFSKSAVAKWSEWYGFSFGTTSASPIFQGQAFAALPQRMRSWQSYAEPVLLAELDLSKVKDTVLDRAALGKIVRSGTFNAVQVFFELVVSETETLTTDPAKAQNSNHWKNLVWLLDSPVEVEEGGLVEFCYHHRVPGNNDGVTVRARG